MRYIRAFSLVVLVLGSSLILAKDPQGQSASSSTGIKTSQKHNPQPVPITEQESLNFLAHKVKPDYPETGKQKKVSGTVVFEVVIDAKDGKVKRIKPISGPSELIPAAEAAAKGYVYDFFGSQKLYQTQITIRF